MLKVDNEPTTLTENTARELLKARGYGMSCPFGHVHATCGNREWHVCTLDALPAMEVVQFFEYLNTTLRTSQQVHSPYVSLVDMT